MTLAQILERTNRVSEARAVLDRLVVDSRSAALGPELSLLQAQLAQRELRHEEACTLFRESLAACKEFHSRHFELFPLAKSLDALGRYEDAFEHWSRRIARRSSTSDSQHQRPQRVGL